MKKWLIGIFVALFAATAHAQYGSIQGWCAAGGYTVTVAGVPSTTYAQKVYPGCTVTVYYHGTTNLATIYKDSSGTPLTNPFTADVVGSSSPGQWTLFGDINQAYDVVLSGGSPVSYPSPVTFTALYPSSSFSTGAVSNVQGTSPITVNGDSGVVHTGGITVACPTCTAPSGTQGQFQIINGSGGLSPTPYLNDRSSIASPIAVTGITSVNAVTGQVVLNVANSFPAGGGTPLMVQVTTYSNFTGACHYYTNDWYEITTAATPTTISYTDPEWVGIGAGYDCGVSSVGSNSFVVPETTSFSQISEDSSSNVTITVPSTAGISTDTPMIFGNFPSTFSYLNTNFQSGFPTWVYPTNVTPTTITFPDRLAHGFQASAAATGAVLPLPSSLVAGGTYHATVIHNNGGILVDGGGGLTIIHPNETGQVGFSLTCNPTAISAALCFGISGYYPDYSRGFDIDGGFDSGAQEFYVRMDATDSKGNNRFSIGEGQGFWMVIPANEYFKLGINNGVSEYDLRLSLANFNAAGKGSGDQEFSIVPAGKIGTIGVNYEDDVAYSATPTFDSVASVNYIVLSGNVTSSTLPAGVDGKTTNFVVCQNAIGGYTFAWPSNVTNVPVVEATANTCTTAYLSYDTTAAKWFGHYYPIRGFMYGDTAHLGSVSVGLLFDVNKTVRQGTIENISGVASSFTCSVNPTITLEDCGTSAGTCATPTALASVTFSAANTITDGTITSASFLAGHYLAWELTAGTCSAIDLNSSAEYRYD